MKELEIEGIEGLTEQEVIREILLGGHFVIYKYCFSYIMTSIKRSSPIYLIRAHENRRKYVWRYFWITFFLGPWGIPNGIAYTLACLRNQMTGGTDLTEEIMNYLL